MDDRQFDEVTRALATGISRRTVLRRLGVGVVGLGLAAIGRRTSRAAPTACAVFCADQPGARGAQCRQTCKACAGGPSAVCFNPVTSSFSCKDLENDPTNCGGCGQVCEEPFLACVSGECACPPGTRTCGGQCVETCAIGEAFIQASCTCRACSELLGVCSTASDCGTGGAADTCQNGCCCVSAGNTALGCLPNNPAPLCCSGMCGSNGRCA